MSCGTQDLLETAIIQRRRLDISCLVANEEKISYENVLPIDISSHQGVEHLTILTVDNQGGILKFDINTAEIYYFEAKDSKKPKILFHQIPG